MDKLETLDSETAVLAAALVQHCYAFATITLSIVEYSVNARVPKGIKRSRVYESPHDDTGKTAIGLPSLTKRSHFVGSLQREVGQERVSASQL